MIYFEWDEAKAAKNWRDHGVSFRVARLIFYDPHRITEEDSVDEGEQRWRTVGVAHGITVLTVIHLEEISDQDLIVRIISARKTTPLERSEYDENRANDI